MLERLLKRLGLEYADVPVIILEAGKYATLLLLILKATSVITWSWYIVFTPMALGFLFVGIIVLISMGIFRR